MHRPTLFAARIEQEVISLLDEGKIQDARDLHQCLSDCADSKADRRIVHELGNLIQKAMFKAMGV